VLCKDSTSEMKCPITDEIIRKTILLITIPIFVLIEKKYNTSNVGENIYYPKNLRKNSNLVQKQSKRDDERGV
jgi:hypothetical protein